MCHTRTSGGSSKLMRLLSFSADLDIFEVPSNRDITRAPSLTISASGGRSGCVCECALSV